ncbi:type I polyketide synthase [uncultured Kordia sp.]|uniref:type I polyketide synthase n=1 Tax=uncultured Kordia sp. TaxID=507699 RepID=UPI00261CF942|nr:type I polyketide synthase [uncultured Kordia sp.]
MKQQNRKKDIAIIGMSCKFSSTENLADYWESLINGDELIEVVEDETNENPAFVDVHSRMRDVESFDYAFFGYTKDEAKVMDPQIRVMHEQAWLAFENAGYDISKYKKQVGVFLSASDNLNWRANTLINSVDNVDFFKVKQLSNKNFLSTLISYSLNLRGPSYYIDTACSSSLSSIHIACRNLLMGECSMALAGGVSINTHVEKGYEYAEGMILSKDGHCRAFDADSSGTISGEGVGVVVLKRYEEAVRDGDHIYAVIRSSAANNDGKRKVGYTAPSIGGQSDCITLAHKIAGIQPNEVSYVEAHGTGTKIGDVIEIESLNKAFQFDTNHKCAVGSVKSNMGHLDAAAGVAALIKTSLMLEHELLVPSLHFKSPNPEVNFKSGPFFVNTETKPWQATEINKPLLAGVSSFGIGGTNVHVLLESYEKAAQPESSPKTALITYSAASESSVNAYEKELSRFIKENESAQLQAISQSLNTGRKTFDYRKYIVVESNNGEYSFKYGNLNIASGAKDGKIAFAFSGQGTQYYQMGKDLYESEPSFREMMDKGFAILSKNSSVDYKGILGYTDRTYDPEFIHNTLNTQPLLFLFEYCIAKLLMNLGVQPSMLIGLSQGEYCAACLSGVFSFEDGLRIMEKRAELMDSIEKGTMVAVNAPYTDVAALLPPEIQVAVINTATSCVISGTKESVQNTLPILEERNFDYTVLKISIASHSKMMEPILEEFAAFFHDIPLQAPQIPFISSSTGAFISDENATSAAYWAKHIRNSVNFLLGSQEIIRSNPSCVIEISPGASISNLIQQNNPEADTTVFLQSVRNAKEVNNDYSQMLQLVGQLWQNGISVNWDSFYNNKKYTKVPCPTYCFDKYKFNARVNVFEALGGFNTNLLSGPGNQPKDWLYKENWKEISVQPHAANTDSDWVICFVNEHSISQNIKESFKNFAGDLYMIQHGTHFEQTASNIITINPKRSEDYAKLGELLSTSINGGHGTIIHSWSIQENTALDFEQCQDLGYFSLQFITRFILEKISYETLKIDVLGNDLFNVYGNETVNYNFCTLLAAVKTIPKEYKHVTCRFIEYSSESNSSTLLNTLINNQFAFQSGENVLAIRGEKAWTLYHDKIQINDHQQTTVFEENGCYLITGASGGVGQVISKFLLAEYNAKLILVGRSEVSASLSAILSEKVKYVQSNIEDEKRLQEGVKQAMTELNETTINGVFHTAGIGDYFGLIKDRSRSNCETIFSPKIEGSVVLNKVCKEYNPTFLMLFSSLAALKNPFGQIGYAAANTYQNFMAKNESATTKIVSVLWDTWKESGMALKSDERISTNTAKVLDTGISDVEGMACIQFALQSNQKEVIVSTIPIERFKAEAESHTLFAVEAMINEEAANQQYSARPNINIEYIAPKTELEIQIAELWIAFFGYDKIGLKDDFFELGGDSLKAMTILKRIEQITGLEIKLKEFYGSPTVESIAKEIQIFQETQEIQQVTSGNMLRI